MENETLASEMLRELKATSRRWFIAFIVVLILWFATIGIFVWYISLPIDELETYEIQQESDHNGVNRIIGGDYYGETNSSENNTAEAGS